MSKKNVICVSKTGLHKWAKWDHEYETHDGGVPDHKKPLMSKRECKTCNWIERAHYEPKSI